MMESSWDFYFSNLSMLSLQQFVSYSSGFPSLALIPMAVFSWISALVSCSSLYLPVGLSDFRGSCFSNFRGSNNLSCFCDGSRNSCLFLDGLLKQCSDFQLLKCWTRNYKSPYISFFCLLILRSCRSSLYTLDRSPLSDVFCKYFLPVCGLPFFFYNSVFWKVSFGYLGF